MRKLRLWRKSSCRAGAVWMRRGSGSRLRRNCPCRFRPIRPAHVSRWLAQQLPETKAVCRQVTAAVCQRVGLTASELKGQSRQQAVSDARGLAMYLVRRLSNASYAQIGKQFGGRDHTTVMHACRKFTVLVARDEAVRHLADELLTCLAAESAL